MPDAQVTNNSPATTPPSDDVANPSGAVTDALARVQEAVADVQESGLQEFGGGGHRGHRRRPRDAR